MENRVDLGNQGSPIPLIQTEKFKTRSKKYTRVKKACVPCSQAHVSCDSERPCSRCIKRGTLQLCCDAPGEKRGRKKKGNPSPSQETDQTQFLPPTSTSSSGLIFDETLDLPIEFQEMLNDILYSFDYNAPPPRTLVADPKWEAMIVKTKLKLQEVCTPEEISEIQERGAALRGTLKSKLIEMFKITNVQDLDYHIAEKNQGIITAFVKDQAKIIDKMGTPTIIWDRSLKTHYLNEAYCKLTKFQGPPPDAWFASELSPQGLKNFCSVFVPLMGNLIRNGESEDTSFFTKVSVRCYDEENKYIHGTLSGSVVLLDSLKLPLCVCAQFLPHEVTT